MWFTWRWKLSALALNEWAGSLTLVPIFHGTIASLGRLNWIDWDSFYIKRFVTAGLFIFFIMPITCPYSLWSFNDNMWLAKSQLCIKQICLPSIKSNVSNGQKWTIEKPLLQSVSIFVEFVHPCLLLYLLRCL